MNASPVTLDRPRRDDWGGNNITESTDGRGVPASSFGCSFRSMSSSTPMTSENVGLRSGFRDQQSIARFLIPAAELAGKAGLRSFSKTSPMMSSGS